MFRPNHTKALLLENRMANGMLHALASPNVAEMMGLAGCDFVVIDGEHGMGGDSEHVACLRALSATSATAILRVPSHEPTAIRRALDWGAEGLLVPDVRTVEQATAAVQACFYPPAGTRGFSAGTIRGSDYGLQVGGHIESQGAELLVCLMIESAEGVANVADIAAVPGVDVIQIGPFDLSQDLGIPGQFEHPDFVAALRRIEKGVKKAGRILGGVPLPGLDMKALKRKGYRMITVGADVPLLAGGLKAALG